MQQQQQQQDHLGGHGIRLLSAGCQNESGDLSEAQRLLGGAPYANMAWQGLPTAALAWYFYGGDMTATITALVLGAYGPFLLFILAMRFYFYCAILCLEPRTEHEREFGDRARSIVRLCYRSLDFHGCQLERRK